MEFGKTKIVIWSLNGDCVGDGIANENIGTDLSFRFQ